jgi:tetratricopeptide (TPR) repeat protein
MFLPIFSIKHPANSLWIAPALILSLGLSACSGSNPSNTLPKSIKNASGTFDKSTAPALKKWMAEGNAHAKARRWQPALQAFNEAIRLDTDYAPAYVQAGWVHAELKQWDDAKTHLLKAISLSPQNAGAHANLAWVYAEKQRWNDVQQEAGKAISIDPNNAYAHATLAWAYQKTGQEPLALAEYEKSVELNPTLDNSHFALGMSYCNQGAAPRAKEHLTHLQKLHSSKVSDLQARISKGCYPPKK